MARKYVTNLDLNRNELQNAKIQNLATDPGTAVSGQIYYNTSANEMRIYNGTIWEAIGLNGVTADAAEINILDGATLSTAELNILDGATLSYSELNILDGATLSTAELNTLDGITASTAELNLMDGVTSTTAELNILDGVTADYAEINILDGATLTTTELNYVDGVTSSIQTQMNTKSPINNPTFTGTVTLPGAPSSDLEAATKGYVDSVSQGLDIKDAVRVATTANGTLATAFANGQVVDGVTLVTGDRILIKSQTTGSENGIYTVNASGAPTRSIDANVSSEVTAGLFTFVSEGTVGGNTGWVLTTDNPITLGTTALVFTQFSGAGAYTAGDGLTQIGTTFDVVAGLGISVTANAVAIDTSVTVRRYATNIGDGTETAIVVTHALNTRDVIVSLFEVASPYAEVIADVEHTTVNTITLRFTVAPTAAQYRVVVHG